ncbi:NUDIX domain-containing protein [Mycoplasma simbae]|uniref:NUDIX domain-containing protein n=1 Tax=Mycoplasma simbae TaxID=36744 RepID=UPI000497F624|nr:NUDIX domain-containing protein [Mycoplasma simbae]
MTKNNTKLFTNDWISVYESEKGFTYCQRKSINSIAALLYRKNKDKYEFLIHYQPLPEIEEKQNWDDLYACPITGSIEPDQSPLECVINEVFEEAGYKITPNNIKVENFAIATTQMNEKVFNFLVEASNLEQFPFSTDGSIFESVAQNKWVSETELCKILAKQIHLSSLASLYLMFKIYVLSQ